MSLAAALEDTEPHVLRGLRKVILGAAAVLASPFLMLTFLFFLLEKPWTWMAVTGSIAGCIFAAALVGYLMLRARIRGVRRSISMAEGYLGTDR